MNGATSARLDALRAIQQRNETMFDLALKAILANWEKHVEERRTSGIADPYFVNVEAPVCIEALALVQVARIHRVPTQRSYPYLSQLALDLPTVSGRPDLWEDLV